MKLRSMWLIAASAVALAIAGCLPPAPNPLTRTRVPQTPLSHPAKTAVVRAQQSPKFDGLNADQLIDRLNIELNKRFDSISDDYFGDDRIPIKYHIHAGVLNPDWFREIQADDDSLKSTPDNLPTDDEQNLMRAIDHKGYYCEVYTLGKAGRFRGPVGDDDIEPTLLGDKLINMSKSILDGHGASVFKGSDDHVQFKLVAIKSTGDTCNSCHQGANTGDRIGVMIYRYWPQAKGDFSAASLQKKSDVNRSLD